MTNSTSSNPISVNQIKESLPSPTKNDCNEHQLPFCPTKLPYPATEANVPKLKEFTMQQFANTAFNAKAAILAMDTQPAHIHLKPDATPHATHVPIPIPHHWKNEIKESIEADVKKGIIEPVPIGEPVAWCAQMVVIPKKMEDQGILLIRRNSMLNALEKHITANHLFNWHVKYQHRQKKLSLMQSMDFMQYL